MTLVISYVCKECVCSGLVTAEHLLIPALKHDVHRAEFECLCTKLRMDIWPCRDIHVSDPDAQAESGLTCADQKLIIGALEYKDKLYALNDACICSAVLHTCRIAMLLLIRSCGTRSSTAVTEAQAHVPDGAWLDHA